MIVTIEDELSRTTLWNVVKIEEMFNYEGMSYDLIITHNEGQKSRIREDEYTTIKVEL